METQALLGVELSYTVHVDEGFHQSRSGQDEQLALFIDDSNTQSTVSGGLQHQPIHVFRIWRMLDQNHRQEVKFTYGTDGDSITELHSKNFPAKDTLQSRVHGSAGSRDLRKRRCWSPLKVARERGVHSDTARLVLSSPGSPLSFSVAVQWHRSDEDYCLRPSP